MVPSVLLYYLFLVLILFYVSPSFQLNEFHQKKNGNRQSSNRRGRGRKIKTEEDISNCQVNDSLCDTVQQLSSVESYLHHITREHPTSTKLNVIGSTFNSRPIYSLEIFRGVDRDQSTTVVLEFGMHGREWASQASAVYTIRQLLEEGHNLTNTVRWFILPMMNPDGYHYSTTKDNMWKKNRQPLNGSMECIGVDIDRNFDVGWDTNSGSEPCKQDYAGSQPFSELESNALKSLIASLGPFAVDIYISVHSCGQSIQYPYGFTTKELSPWKLERLTEAGTIMAKAMKQLRNRNYDVEVAYKFGGLRGSSADYMFDRFHIPYVYTLELGDKVYYEDYDLHHCYHPPLAIQMDFLTKECFAGVVALVSHVSAMKRIPTESPRTFNSFPSITSQCSPLFALITLLS